MRGKITYIILFFLTALALPVRGQGTFEKKIETGGDIKCYSIKEDKDGSFLCGVLESGFESIVPMLARIDQNGNVIWVESIFLGDSARYYLNTSTCLGFDSNIILAEGVTRIGNNRNREYIASYSKEGKEQWQTALSNISVYSEINLIADQHDSTYIMLNSPDFTQDTIRITKINREGKVLWSRSCISKDTNASITSAALSITENGYFLACGTEHFAISLEVDKKSGVEIAYLSRDGNLLWSKLDSTPISVYPISAISLTNGDYAVFGYTLEETPDYSYRYYIGRFDSSGNLLWGKKIDAHEDMFPGSVAEAANGDLILSGSMRASFNLKQAISDSLLIVRVSPEGSILSSSVLSIPHVGEQARKIIRTKDNAFAICGVIKDSVDVNNSSLLIMKLDSSLDGCFFQNIFVSDSSIGRIDQGSLKLSVDTTVKNIQTEPSEPVKLKFTERDLCTSVTVKEPVFLEYLQIQLSPNPISSKAPLTISINGGLSFGNYTLSLLDLLGNRIKSEKVQLTGVKQEIPFDVSECAAGVYIIELQNENGIEARAKFVKE